MQKTKLTTKRTSSIRSTSSMSYSKRTPLKSWANGVGQQRTYLTLESGLEEHYTYIKQIDNLLPKLSVDSRNKVLRILNHIFPEQASKAEEVWFGSSFETKDEYIIKEFSEDVEMALKAEYNEWLNYPLSTLAYIILLEVFAKKIYTGTKKCMIPAARHSPLPC
eukprot:UN01226